MLLYKVSHLRSCSLLLALGSREAPIFIRLLMLAPVPSATSPQA